MEELLGQNLMKDINNSAETKVMLKEKSLVLLYFSASWCPPCRAFTPLLTEFYEKCCKPNQVEIVFVSSDQDIKSFTAYFEKMPWTSLPAQDTRTIKEKLSKSLQVQGIPYLVVLDAKSGHFVTSGAKAEVQSVGGDVSKGNALIASWKAKDAVPIEDAVLSEQKSIVGSIISFILRNPMNVVALLFFFKSAVKKFNETYNTTESDEL